MRALGIIPARGGSKKVQGKNIRLLNNKPLVVYTIEAAQQSKRLDRLIVSTDNSEIAEICRKAGAELPFMRPAYLAQDNTPDKPMLIHAIKWLKVNGNYLADITVILRPTTPFKTPQIINKVIQMLEETGADSVRTVTRAEGVHHPFWMFKKYSQNRAKPFIAGIESEKYYQRQSLPPVYRLNGVVDAIKTDVVLNQRKLYGYDMRILEIPEEISIDIDIEFDFKICEILIKEKLIKK